MLCVPGDFFAFLDPCRNFSQGRNLAGNGWKVIFGAPGKGCEGSSEGSVTQGTLWEFDLFENLICLRI